MDGVLFLIPARGGSARVPGKNLRLVGGMPLVGRTVRMALAAAGRLDGGPHRVVCSTDDPAIAAAARAWGAETPFERPATLATSDATSVDVALHALDALAVEGARFRAIVLLQPTSPLTDPSDLVAAIERFDVADGAGVVSVTSTHPASWHLGLDEGGSITRLVADDADLIPTGAFYVADPTSLASRRRFIEPGVTIGVRVSPERSVDIDEPIDLLVAEATLAATPVATFALGGRVIGEGAVLVIAEAGVNHDGDPAVAHRLVDAAADAGADVVKFQTYDPDLVAAAGAPRAAYQVATGEPQDDQRSMLARLALPTDAWAALRDHALARGLIFLSTPTDLPSADLLDRLDVPAFKIGSGELTNLPFLVDLAERGRPILLSTGMGDMIEVAAAVDAIRATGNRRLALFHCVSSYPARFVDANLRAIQSLQRAFGVPAGWSDHTPGTELAIAAAALGACMIEKHLTLDRTMPGPDHRSSLEPVEFSRMVTGIRAVGEALGNGEKVPVAAEQAIASVVRRSLHWASDVREGAPVRAIDLIALRPGTGIAPGRIADVVERKTTRAVVAGTMVVWEDLE